MKKQPHFATEVALCERFLAAVKKGGGWTPYAETAGWDILLVRDADGVQIGIQAKLRCNIEVINQSLEEYGAWAADRNGPDYRAILVPDSEARGLDRVADYIGLTIIRVTPPAERGIIRADFRPYLPKEGGHQSAFGDDWHEWCPTRRHKLPEYVPDVAAGSAAPMQLTRWKISAIKIAILLERRGHVTRADFKHIGIDHRRWLTGGMAWLRVSNGVYVRDRLMPNFKAIHPRNYDEIASDFDAWAPKDLMSAMAPALTTREGRSA